MKALSIRQPWAWAILNAGKDVENRDWSEHYPGYHQAKKLVADREPFLLHASSGMTAAEYHNFYNAMHAPDGWMALSGWKTKVAFSGGLPSFETIPRGGIVGIARIADIVTVSPSPWFFGPIGLVLENVRPTKFVAFKGAQGFFNVPDAIAREALFGYENEAMP